MLKVAITGPESTGKSTICEKLALHYNTVWVPEYARSYVASLDHAYTLEDVEAIAKGQLEFEQKLLSQANAILFADTDMLVIKIWCEHAFGYCPRWVLEELQKREYNLYLLMGVDLPWEPDPQREHPHMRQYFYDWYKRELEAMKVPFVEINGQKEERLQQACKHIDTLLQRNR